MKYIKFLKHMQVTLSPTAKNPHTEEQNNLQKSLDDNITSLKKVFGKSDDVIFREFYFGVKNQTKAFICLIDGLGDKNLIIEDIVKSLMVNMHVTDPSGKLVDKHNLFNDMKNYIINIVETKDVKTIDEAVNAVLSGNTLLLLDGCTLGFSISAKVKLLLEAQEKVL